MPEFCDVALPVPLDMVFTYRVAAEAHGHTPQQTLTQQEETLSKESEAAGPVIGGRVLVPFRQQRMTGIVVATVIIFALLIGGADYGLGLIVKQVYTSNNTTTGPSRCLEAPCHGELQVDELAKVLEDSKHQTLAGN